MNQLRIFLLFDFLSHTHFNSVGLEIIAVRRGEKEPCPSSSAFQLHEAPAGGGENLISEQINVWIIIQDNIFSLLY